MATSDRYVQVMLEGQETHVRRLHQDMAEMLERIGYTLTPMVVTVMGEDRTALTIVRVAR